MESESQAVEVVEEEAIEIVETEGEMPEVEDDDDSELVVTIGDEPPPSEEGDDFAGQPAPKWAKELRKTSREKDKKIKELEAKLNGSAEKKPAELGAKPKLEDFEYDSDEYEKAIESWHDRKIKHDSEQSTRRQAEEIQQKEWAAKIGAYDSEKTKLKVSDFEEAESVVQGELSETQQGIILHGSDNAPLLVYALGKNPKKAKELAAINDPVKFAFAVAKLEKELKVTNRKAPPPENKVGGSGRVSTAVTGSALEQLKEKARQSGDWTAYFEAKSKSNSK